MIEKQNKAVKLPSGQDQKIIVALDFNKRESALEFVDLLDPTLCRLKVGKEMFTYFGPDFVKQLISRDFSIFLDLKFHDIPNTVANACLAAADLGVWMINLHASGGRKMMAETVSRLNAWGKERPLLTAVTILTSMSDAELKELGIDYGVEAQVAKLAGLANECGLDGVVCSAREATLLKSKFGKSFKLVTPGIRPKGASLDDQTRVVSPAEALSMGADYLVIGRPITKSSDPLKSLCEISESIQTPLEC